MFPFAIAGLFFSICVLRPANYEPDMHFSSEGYQRSLRYVPNSNFIKITEIIKINIAN